MPKIVYSPRYNIRVYGFERLHSFDSRKYGRAWKKLQEYFGSALKELHLRPTAEVSRDELLLVHSKEYLQHLRDSRYVARALEVPQVGWLPGWAIDWHILRPMRWGTAGTILAAREALKHGFVLNLSGGYHHAKPNRGEGFSIYADAGIALAKLRQEKLISDDDRIVYIDTDAHQGNGVCHTFMHNDRVLILDIYNRHIYPAYDEEAKIRIDCPIPIDMGCGDENYMTRLRACLPNFLDFANRGPIGLAIYNAGTDVYAKDPLGALNISTPIILERDLYVVSELRKRNIPTIMLLSGGYTPESFQLVATSAIGLIEMERTKKYPQKRP